LKSEIQDIKTGLQVRKDGFTFNVGPLNIKKFRKKNKVIGFMYVVLQE